MKTSKESKKQKIFKKHTKKGNCGGCKEVGGNVYLCGLKAYHGEGCSKWIKLP